MTGQILHNLGRLGRRSFGRLLLLAVPLLLAGCTLGFIYPRLDTLVGWQLDRYLRLETGQERWLDERLEERLSWHQREQLPQWRAGLAALRADIAEGRLDADRHRWHGAQIRQLVQASLAGLEADTVQLASQLTDKQVNHLLARFAEDTAELQEELAERAAEPEAAAEDRIDDLLDELRDWLGPLTDEQKHYVRQWQAQAIHWDEYRLESRQRWQAFLVEALAARTDATALQAAVHQMLMQPERLRTAAYQQAIEQQAEHRRALHLYLASTLTEAQRRHLLAELDDLLEDLDDLLAE